MADKLLRDPDNKLWVDPSGKLIKQRSYGEILTTRNLLIDYSAENTIKVNGYVTEWLNRDQTQPATMSNKLVQSNASFQMKDYGTFVLPDRTFTRYYPSGFTTYGANVIRTFFVVFDSTAAYTDVLYYLTGSTDGSNNWYISNSGTSPFVGATQFLDKRVSGIVSSASIGRKLNIISFVFEYNPFTAQMDTLLGEDRFGNSGKKIYGGAVYSGYLTEQEMAYNVNVLKLRYNIA